MNDSLHHQARTAAAITDQWFDRSPKPSIHKPANYNLERLGELAKLSDFIQAADVFECKLIINELIDRVSTLTGCAKELEDASCALTSEIERG